MKHVSRCGRTAAAAFILGFLFCAPAPAAGARSLVRVVVRDAAERAAVASAGLEIYAHWRTDAELVLLAGADESTLPRLAERGLEATLLDRDMRLPSGDGLRTYTLAYPPPHRPHPDWQRYGRLLLDDGTRALLELAPADAAALAEAGAELRVVMLEPKPLPSLPGELPAPATISPDPVIQGIIDQVDSLEVLSITSGLSGGRLVTVEGEPFLITSRYTYIGTPIRKATHYVGEQFAALGLNVDYHQWAGHDYPNVIGGLRGLTKPDSIYILCAHLDDLPVGPLAPGADDNGSGATTVLLAAQILSRYAWAYTLRFACWTGEEQGQLGSYYYAQRCYGWGEKIAGVLNLDMIAYNTIGSTPIMGIHANMGLPRTLEMAALYSDVVDAYSLDLVPEIFPAGTDRSDHASFWEFGYPAILGIEDFDDFNPYYHTSNDRMAHFDKGYYTQMVRAAIGTFAHLCGGPLASAEVAARGTGAGAGPAARGTLRLDAPHPNPLVTRTSLRYELARPCAAGLRIYDVSGALVATLSAGPQAAGPHETVWDGRDARGEPCPPGLYFCRVESGSDRSDTRKLLLVR